MYKDSFEIKTINLNRESERKKVDIFLQSQGLILEKDVDYTLAIYENDSIIGTGSISGNVLKCIAIAPDYKGEGFSNKLMTLLVDEQFKRGNTHLFIFTKPQNKKIFEDLGFKEIISVDEKVSLLENKPRGLEYYLEKLKLQKRDGYIISGIVMNCNPFTFGHQYLIEEASRYSDVVHIFVVWEDRSIFPKEVRLRLVKEGTAHLKNVYIHKGEDYIVSNSTFPSYFLKEKNAVVKTHAMLDVKIFGEFIAPSLGINRRYVGEEPNDPVTNEYNITMKEILPEYNIEIIEIKRLQKDEMIISASKVRELIRTKQTELLEKLVPITTYNYLISDEAKPIIEKIMKSSK